MTTIFCAIPELGSVFHVDIDIAHNFVGELKNKIKEVQPHTICFDADMLRLYLAKSDGMWLNSSDEDVRALERGEVRERVGNLMLEHLLLVPNEKLNHDAYFGKRFKPVAHDIHVLVEMPEDCEFSGSSNMVTIFCAIPELGSVFSVDVNIRHTVGQLKRKIKEAKSHTICFDANLLRLYLAKSDGMWLNSNDEDVRALERGEVRERVGNLMLEHLLLPQNEKLNHDAYFGKRFKLVARDIHVLVEMPEDCEFPGSSNMVTISCAIPELGSVFPVHVNIRHTVHQLKRKIKEAKPHTICFDADLLRLYLTKSDGMWLNENDEDVRALERGEIRERVGNLMLKHLLLPQNEKLNHDAYFGKRFKPVARDVHVLVEMPEDCEFPGSSNMVTIFCAIPGAGSVFPVHINTTQTFGDLKNTIKEAKPTLVRYDADLLKLYLAKDRGGWLTTTTSDHVKNLMKEQLTLDETWQLDDSTCFGRDFEPAAHDIHIIVKRPEDQKEFIDERSGSTVSELFPLQSLQAAVEWLFGMNQEGLQKKKTD